MTLLLDTCVWIWLLDDPGKLSPKAKKAIHASHNELLAVSAISCWEVARKESLGRLKLSMSSRSWLRQAEAAPGLRLIGVNGEISGESCHLPGDFHRDPADQIIVATARVVGLTLLTSDERIRSYQGVRTLW